MIKRALVVLAMVALISLFGFLTEPWLLIFGWFHFCARNVRQVRIYPASVITGTVFVALLVAAIHACGSSFCRADSAVTRRWHIRWTLAILAVIVVMFVTSLSTIGLVRHAGWMFSSTDPTYKETVQHKEEF